jgi:hydroxymethylglutaryl-CoA reductase (NADPH)
MKDQGYEPDHVASRRAWLEEKTGASLEHVGSYTIPSESMRGNIENPVGTVQMPLGIAGPLLIQGQHARDVFYVPLATTEGALVRSYERGMVAMTRSGGVTTRVHQDENRMAPVFCFADIEKSHTFTTFIYNHFERIRQIAESTTNHGKLLRLECHPQGREVIVNFCYFTGDAHGMNMIMKATDHACRWIMEQCDASHYYIFSGFSSEKHASGSLFAGGKGKKVTAGARIPGAMVKRYLHTTPEQMLDMAQKTMRGHIQANSVGYNGHYANGLAALFIACGQDVANIVNSAVGVTNYDILDGEEETDLYVSVTLPSLTVATVGGGTAMGSSHECLATLGCVGNGKAAKLAEIVTATVLAGEISMGAAIASGEFVNAHETYGRNRPKKNTPEPEDP